MARLPSAPDLPVDPLADRLILLYVAAERALDRLIAGALNRGASGTARYFENQQRQVTAILAKLRRKAAPLQPALARSAYRTGVSAVDRVLDRSQAFSGVHAAAEEVIAANLEDRLRYAEERIGRSAEDAIRRVSLEEVGIAVGAGLSPRQQAQRLEGRLARLDHEQIRRDGGTAFVDRKGRRWRLGAYAAMVCRTTTREAASVGMKNRLIEHGRDLVEISEHRNACVICRPLQGKTYSLTGYSKNYPVLEELPPFHPNCRHVLLPARVSFEEMEKALGLGPDPNRGMDEVAKHQPLPEPVKIEASPSTIEYWQSDEQASWEDAGLPEEGSHPYLILGRMKTRIELRTIEEIERLLKSAEYHGDAAGWGDDRHAFRAAVARIAEKLRELLLRFG